MSIPNDIAAVPLFSRQVPRPLGVIFQIESECSYFAFYLESLTTMPHISYPILSEPRSWVAELIVRAGGSLLLKSMPRTIWAFCLTRRFKLPNSRLFKHRCMAEVARFELADGGPSAV